MNRRSFLRSAFAATATGLLVPEWILDPLKGRSMVSVPRVWAGMDPATKDGDYVVIGTFVPPEEYILIKFPDGTKQLWTRRFVGADGTL